MGETINMYSKQYKPEITPKMIKRIVIGIVAIFVIAIGFSMFYTVQEEEHVAIITFGEFTGEQTEAGLYFKAPYPIQKVVKVPAKLTQKINIGFREDRDGNIIVVEEEALMITGDENIVHADAIVEWKIENVHNYLYNIGDGISFLRNSATSAIRSVIGSQNLDYAITDGKTEIQALVTEQLKQLQLNYKTGIHIIEVKFQDIEPPSGEVDQAFKNVTNAREEKNTKINNAHKYENEKIPVARGEAQALMEKAGAIKEARIFTAQGDVAKFNAIYEEYKKNPDITESRLILETIEKILPNAKIIITDGNGSTVNYLPLNELMSKSSKDSNNDKSSTLEGGDAR